MENESESLLSQEKSFEMDSNTEPFSESESMLHIYKDSLVLDEVCETEEGIEDFQQENQEESNGDIKETSTEKDSQTIENIVKTDEEKTAECISKNCEDDLLTSKETSEKGNKGKETSDKGNKGKETSDKGNKGKETSDKGNKDDAKKKDKKNSDSSTVKKVGAGSIKPKNSRNDTVIRKTNVFDKYKRDPNKSIKDINRDKLKKISEKIMKQLQTGLVPPGLENEVQLPSELDSQDKRKKLSSPGRERAHESFRYERQKNRRDNHDRTMRDRRSASRENHDRTMRDKSASRENHDRTMRDRRSASRENHDRTMRDRRSASRENRKRQFSRSISPYVRSLNKRRNIKKILEFSEYQSAISQYRRSRSPTSLFPKRRSPLCRSPLSRRLPPSRENPHYSYSRESPFSHHPRQRSYSRSPIKTRRSRQRSRSRSPIVDHRRFRDTSLENNPQYPLNAYLNPPASFLSSAPVGPAFPIPPGGLPDDNATINVTPQYIHSNPPPFVANPPPFVANPPPFVPNPASFVSNPAPFVSNPAPFVSNPAPFVSNPAPFASNPVPYAAPNPVSYPPPPYVNPPQYQAQNPPYDYYSQPTPAPTAYDPGYVAPSYVEPMPAPAPQGPSPLMDFDQVYATRNTGTVPSTSIPGPRNIIQIDTAFNAFNAFNANLSKTMDADTKKKVIQRCRGALHKLDFIHFNNRLIYNAKEEQSAPKEATYKAPEHRAVDELFPFTSQFSDDGITLLDSIKCCIGLTHKEKNASQSVTIKDRIEKAKFKSIGLQTDDFECDTCVIRNTIKYKSTGTMTQQCGVSKSSQVNNDDLMSSKVMFSTNKASVCPVPPVLSLMHMTPAQILEAALSGKTDGMQASTAQMFQKKSHHEDDNRSQSRQHNMQYQNMKSNAESKKDNFSENKRLEGGYPTPLFPSMKHDDDSLRSGNQSSQSQNRPYYQTHNLPNNSQSSSRNQSQHQQPRRH